MTRRLLKSCCLGLALAGLGLLPAGCQSSESTAEAQVSPGAVSLCTACGQIKGRDVCCQQGAALCPACGLAKGSPGCCVIDKDGDPVALCTSCGQIKGSDVCCQPGQTTCAKCGLVKGSPGCCKIDQG